MAGLSSYNFKEHVASDIGVDELDLPSENIQSKQNMDKICGWTDQKIMKLNEKKSKVMVINFTHNY